MERNNIILFGVPRSGTSWLSEILTSNDIKLVHEPDNELISFLGFHFKTKLHRFPYLKSNEQNDNFHQLFELALNKKIKEPTSKYNKYCFKFYNKPKEKIQQNFATYDTCSTKKLPMSDFLIHMLVEGNDENRKLVKTVHSILSLPYLVNNFNITPVVILRNPLSVHSSYVQLNMPDKNRKIFKRKQLLTDFNIPIPEISDKNEHVKSGFQLAFFYKVIEYYRKQYPQIIFVQYEDLLYDTFGKIRHLCDQLSIEYSSTTEKFIKAKMKPGKGYQTLRDPKKQIDVWKKRLNTQQINDFLSGYQLIPNEMEYNYNIVL